MRIPITLPVVDVQVAADGGLAVSVDGVPYDVHRPLERGDLQSVVAQITAELQSPVRVDVVEADGTAYADIATPPELAASVPSADVAGASAADAGSGGPGLAASGFDPGEQVAITYVLARHTADADGATSLQLPPALLAAHRRGLVLVGLTSGRVTPLEDSV